MHASLSFVVGNIYLYVCIICVCVRYGSTYNPNVRYSIPPPPLPHRAVIDDEDDFPLHLMAARNEYDGAMEDFTNASPRGRDDHENNNDNNEARIFPPAPAMLFAEAALVSDPIKARWHNLHQLNECHPSLVKVPTMVVRFFFVFPLRTPPFALVFCCMSRPALRFSTHVFPPPSPFSRLDACYHYCERIIIDRRGSGSLRAHDRAGGIIHQPRQERR